MTSVKKAPIVYADVKTHVKLHHYRGERIPANSESNYTIDTHIWPFLDLMRNGSTNAG
jgi:hypothetical protein